jgi:hypothetical protein
MRVADLTPTCPPRRGAREEAGAVLLEARCAQDQSLRVCGHEAAEFGCQALVEGWRGALRYLAVRCDASRYWAGFEAGGKMVQVALLSRGRWS